MLIRSKDKQNSGSGVAGGNGDGGNGDESRSSDGDEDMPEPGDLLRNASGPSLLPKPSIDPCIDLDAIALRGLISDEPLVTETYTKPVKNDAQVVAEEKQSMDWDW